MINKELQKYVKKHKNCYFITGDTLFSNPYQCRISNMIWFKIL
ncbi:hypothetical protein HMPREF0220_2726 [Clostridioides difficile NAP08]|uniref:Uncharacterized protein n=1 Tax=Clostridioides difficile NAP08 TaxID=525259 RepID=D5Q744_CLODI|nr:hypothetical protein HMPREF0220_2726 [Clostridioides difficile NAP08]EFH15869.1 hypothetical protein HMPREF0219_1514 [Clostridioides difficile NAP07]CCK86846.1 conserved hypothetical protein [Clostridioides difficile T5]CCK93934.1 conserved hypothetical protein [Clostridioides difficile T20]CCK97675.1 conserved hypothetical protein [Clostridioides difficile E1]CCK98063.1 conserved hypothetical protein [Clostridioides difficile E10]